MKYNMSLDLLAHAVECFANGKTNEASVAFARAAKHPSIQAALAAIEATNSKAFAVQSKMKVKAAKPSKVSARLSRLTASEADMDAQNVGEDLRIEVEENSKLREVQEAALDDFEEDDADDMEATVNARFSQSLKNIHAASK
jgi:preprotein translocase subunit SecF